MKRNERPQRVPVYEEALVGCLRALYEASYLCRGAVS